MQSYQSKVNDWMVKCFGSDIAADGQERNYRFMEEALELFQACGGSMADCLRIVDYVFGRPVGEPAQEVGGVMVTVSALCSANDINLSKAAKTELFRVEGKIEQIRQKHFSKEIRSPLPGSYQTDSK